MQGTEQVDTSTFDRPFRGIQLGSAGLGARRAGDQGRSQVEAREQGERGRGRRGSRKESARQSSALETGPFGK